MTSLAAIAQQIDRTAQEQRKQAGRLAEAQISSRNP